MSTDREAGGWDLSAAANRPQDALLGCLQVLARLYARPVSADALTAGLPLVDHRLTPALFVRAAVRAGLSAKLVKRPLSAISDLVLPAVVLLDGQDACVLVRRTETGMAQVILAETGTGETEMAMATLEQRYSGYALFARPAYRFDARLNESVIPRAQHWFWGVVARCWPVYGEVLVASLLVNLFALALPLFTMNVYDRVVPNHAITTLWALAIGVAIVAGFDLLMRTLRGYFIDAAGKKIDLVLSANIFERLLGIQMVARPPSVGGFASNLQEFESFREFLTSATITTLIDLPFTLIFITVLFWVGGPLGWVALLCVPLILGVGLALQAPLSDLVKATSRLAAQRQGILVESLVGLETLKVTGAEGAMQRRWEQVIGQVAKLSNKTRLLSAAAVNFSQFVQQFSNVAVVVFGVYLIGADKLTVGGLIASTILTGRALAPLAQVAALLTRYHQSRQALASIDRLMQMPVERPLDSNFLHRPQLAGAIEFRHVTFSYQNQSSPVLADVSFRIAAGERVALIGRIGSGKTTIEKLILGLYAPTAGSILVDGSELRQLDPAALRRDIGYVPQDVLLFQGSVRDNIVLGAPYAEDAAVLRAAEIAGVTEFVSRSSSGFDLPVGERGEGLSGGQRQAVAIARAELLTPPVLLLDEPTSAMDNRSEEQFKARLQLQLDRRTLVLVTHRASLLSLVDRIIVIDQGRVVADGPRDQVLAALAGGKISVAA